MTREHGKSIFILSLYLILALCCMLVMAAGAGVYGRICESMESNYETRTVLNFCAAKARSADYIEVARLGGTSALGAYEEADGTLYVSYIYAHDGWLYEMLVEAEAGISFLPEEGERIVQLSDISFTRRTDTVVVTCGGKSVALRNRTDVYS